MKKIGKGILIVLGVVVAISFSGCGKKELEETSAENREFVKNVEKIEKNTNLNKENDNKENEKKEDKEEKKVFKRYFSEGEI